MFVTSTSGRITVEVPIGFLDNRPVTDYDPIQDNDLRGLSAGLEWHFLRCKADAIEKMLDDTGEVHPNWRGTEEEARRIIDRHEFAGAR